MYGVYPYWNRANFHPVWATNQIQALDLIRQSIQAERNDELFYDELIRLTPSKEQAAIIASVRDDECEHNRMFRSMYKALTGQAAAETSTEASPKLRSYDEGLQEALMGELATVEKYRKIWFGLPVGVYRDTVFGIILDEQKHASKYNYLFTLNRTNGKKR